jgi:glycine cleavage system aminomethyltransferase T
VTVGGAFAGNVTSSVRSGVLGHGVSLGWLECGADGAAPARVTAGALEGEVAIPPFYDPEGVWLRA